jgi:hypothetical protein
MSGKKKEVSKPVANEQKVKVTYNGKVTLYDQLIGKTLDEAREYLYHEGFPRNALMSIVNFAGSGKAKVRSNYKLKASDEISCQDPMPVEVNFENKTVSKTDFVGLTVSGVCDVLRKKWKKLPEKLGVQANYEKVEPDYVLQSGDTLTLSYPAVKVICGSNGEDHTDLIGKSVAYVRKHLSESHNIKKTMSAIINGEDVENEKATLLKNGDELEFVDEDGRHG